MWEAIGAIVLFVLALVFTAGCIGYELGGRTMRETVRFEQAENRAQRRAEAREAKTAAMASHALSPWPETDERLTTTGEMRALTAAAEAGDLAEVRRQNAAFFRRLDLRRWVRAA